MHPRVSVIITNYNYARFLGSAVDSALSQHPGPEVVVVDDGSTDDSREVIESYGDEVIAVLKENGGQTSAFNAGLEASSGDPIVFLDADDVLLPDAVPALQDALAADADAAVSKAHWQMRDMDETGKLGREFVPPEPLPAGDLKDAVIRDGPAAIECPPTSGNAWQRRFLEQIFPLPEPGFSSTTSDDAFMSVLAAMFGRVVRVDRPLSAFRRHGESNYGSQPFDVRLAHSLAVHERLCDGLARICAQRELPVDRERWDRLSWITQLQRLVERLHDHIPPGEAFMLIDDNAFDLDETAGRRAVPLVSRRGVYWGAPADDAAAVAALEAHLAAGVRFLALAPHSEWWREAYPALFARLRHQARTLVADDYLTLYELEPSRR